MGELRMERENGFYTGSGHFSLALRTTPSNAPRNVAGHDLAYYIVHTRSTA